MNPINPEFLKQIDKYLLQNHPLVWITRIHYVLVFTFYIFLLSYLLGWLFPIDLIQPNSLGIYYLLFILISITLYVIWIYRNSIYNIENQFGLRSIYDEYKLFACYFITVTLLCTNYIPFEAVYKYRMANSISDEQFALEINTLNLADPFFVTDETSYKNFSVKYQTKNDNTVYYNYTEYENWGRFRPSFYDSWSFFSRNGYSSIKNKLIISGVLSDSLLKNKFNVLKKDPSLAKKLITDYISIFKKYNRPMYFSTEYVYKNYQELTELGNTIQTPGDLSNNLTEGESIKNDIINIYKNVGEAKFDAVFYTKFGYYFFMWYLIFYLVIVFMMFRNVNWQQFIITLVSIALLPLIIFIIINIMFQNNNGSYFFMGICLLIYLSVFIYSIKFGISPPQQFTSFGSILLQLSNIITPIAPFLFIVYAHNVFDFLKYNIPYELSNFDIYYDGLSDSSIATLKQYPAKAKEILYQQLLQNYWREVYEKFILATQIIGMVLYLFVYMPFIKEQFVRLKALPRKS